MSWGIVENKSLSQFFDENSFVKHSLLSMYGDFKRKIEEIFKKNDMKDYKIPKIIVIGEESSGKSSLLENITKCPIFPRDTKYCTKTPIHLTLKHHTHSINEIRYKGAVMKVEKLKIVDEITKIFESIGDNVSEEPIEIIMASSDLQDFQFYDLPGIRAYPAEMSNKTKNICKKYLESDDVLVICVIPSTNTRLTSSDALALIQKYNKTSQTILALTMVDRLQPVNIKNLLIDRIVGASDEINNIGLAGCIGVFNRTHSDTVNLKTHNDEEQLWFKNFILDPMPKDFNHLRHAIEENITSKNLIKKLDNLFKGYICERWIPKAIIDAELELTNIDVSAKGLGENPKNMNLAHVITLLSERISKLWFGGGSCAIHDYNDDVYDDVDELTIDVSNQTHNDIWNERQCSNAYNFINNVKNQIEIYIPRIQKMFNDKINDCFDSYCSLKLVRFTKVKDYAQDVFVKQYEQHYKELSFKLDSHLASLSLIGEDESRKPSLVAINKILLHVLYPSKIALKKHFLAPDEMKTLFIENDEYLIERSLLNERRSKILQGIVELNNLRQTNQ